MSRLRALRKKRNITQVKIQMETGIDQSNYSKIERGIREPSYHECKALALMLNTSMDYIAGLTDEKKPYRPAGKAEMPKAEE